MPIYSWLAKTDAVAALQARLSGSQQWTDAELWLYVVEGLRFWNSLTEQWNTDFPLPVTTGDWVNTGTTANSPRLRSVTDVDLYTAMQYMLLEPPTGGTWTGTSQFALSDLQSALQKRTQEVIQATQSNFGLVTVPTNPGTRRNLLGDTILQPQRIRFLGVVSNGTATAASGSFSITLGAGQTATVGSYVTGTGITANTFVTRASGAVIALSRPTTGVLSNTPVQFSVPQTLSREDTQSFQYFEPDYLQTWGTPVAWSVASEPPLSFDVDVAPNAPGMYDVVALQAGPTFAPPTASLLGVPDDWSWVPMYGALGDVLSKEAEATDRARAAYCMQRYEMGLEAMKGGNWLVQATLNGLPVDTASLYEQDVYAPEWQVSTGNIPGIVQAGMDFLAPTPGQGQSVIATLVGNAPLLDATNTYVQVSRDDWNQVLDYSCHLAMFKQGNQDFQATTSLFQNFIRGAVEVNKRIATYGLFVNVLKEQGQRENLWVPR